MKYLIVGLGNPGEEYSRTRHNIGFRMADALADACGATFTTQRYASVATLRIRSQEAVVIKPSTFMNLSGKAVRYWMQQEKIPVERLLVLVDDIALPLGTLRMRTKGGAGGHNGLKDIEAVLGSAEYARLRFGVGNGFARGGQVDYVLGDLSEEEKAQVPALANRIIQGIKDMSTIGIQRAMNSVNTRPKTEKNGPEAPEM